ncbi:hypothetical protein BD626DRAFT_487699 [Schizophyllum amplum]|uniref:Uncharacterized protein n=1 Tax=Schizophyllum amplum TaxID=97359 RepID=A0A550CNM3_9AGAR|nr:hypothetical protein BD626DRAFT_487699 [Auriculariopsis ampla]
MTSVESSARGALQLQIFIACAYCPSCAGTVPTTHYPDTNRTVDGCSKEDERQDEVRVGEARSEFLTAFWYDSWNVQRRLESDSGYHRWRFCV